MKNHYLLILTLFLSAITFANTGDGDKKTTPTKVDQPAAPMVSVRRSFAALDAKIEKDIQLLAKAKTKRDFSNDELQARFKKDSTIQKLKAKAENVIKKLEEEAKFLDNLTPYLTGDTPIALPIGIKKEVGSSKFIMGVSKIKLGKDYSELEIFVRIQLPQVDETGKQRELFFGASGVKLSHKGGLFGDADLVLLGDVGIPFQGKEILMILKGGFDLKSGDLDKKTYVTIDCNGFKELGLAVDVEFSREKLLPVKADNTIDNSKISGTNILKKVTTSFEIVASDWNDILVEVNLPKFQVPTLKNTIFELNTAVFDFSDVRNSGNMTWPQGYQETYLIEGEEDLWRGVYVESLTIVLPKQFSKKGSNTRVAFGAEKMLIDNNGVTGTFKGENILPIQEGSADGWQFSVDRFQVSFLAGNLISAGFGGAIVLPVTTETVTGQQTETFINAEGIEETRLKKVNQDENKTTVLVYNALIDPLNEGYVLNATTSGNLSFDIFKAKATLTENSYIELKLKEERFMPKAVLHGNMAIKGSNSGSSTAGAAADFQGITFQDFQLQTVSPIISIGHAGYKGDVKVGDFPVTISEIGIRAQDNIAALDFTIAINLMGSGDGGFSGNTSLSVEGELKKGEHFKKWKFKRIKLHRVEIAADIGFKIEGFVEFREDDPVYGNGFAGMVKAEFEGGIAVTISATFGKTEFRYWYVDGLVKGLNIVVPTGLAITGFGGGAAYHMKKESGGSNMGVGSSGVNYVPDRDSGLNVKAMLLFSIAGGEQLVNGGFGFEMAFNTKGGINRISLYGEAHMMQMPGYSDPGKEMSENLGGIVENESNMSDAVENSLKESNLIEASKSIYPATMQGQKGLNAYVAIEFDFVADTFHGTFELYIDVLGGMFKGVGNGGRAGWAVVHFGADAWYIHVGTPSDPIGLKMGIDSLSLESKSYFMMGDYLEPSPPPPSEVANILGVDLEELDYMRDENALKGGRGIAFGSHFSFDTGDITFLMLYARFQAGFGFDIMIKDYGDTICRGSGQIGINGWYANGQAYVYLQGKLGIKVKIFRKRKRITIIEAGAATLMQAKLPNPVWMRGYLAGHYRLLGGLIKGRFRFEMQFGNECDIISGGSPIDGLKIIADIKPRDKATDVDVFAIPQVAFNMQVNEPIEMEDEEGILRYYRFKIDQMTLKDETGKSVKGNQELNNHGDLLSFTSEEILPPEKKMKLYVSVTFEEKIDGIWTAMKEDGEVLKEEENYTFTTGIAPDYIPLHNVAYSYPVIDQQYFFPKEYNKAYVKLKRGQDYLFKLKTGWSQRAFFVDEFDQAVESGLSYSAGKKEVQIPLPVLDNEKEYSLKLLTLPPDANQASMTENYTSKNLSEDGENTIETKSVSLEGLTTNPETIEMLSYDFRTSIHDTFKKKIESKSFVQGIQEIIYADVHALQVKIVTPEAFEAIELLGNAHTGETPLIQIEATLDDAYYKNEVYPLIYKNYPLNNKFRLDRNVTTLGVPPKKSIDVLSWYQSYLKNDPTNSSLKQSFAYRYNLPFQYKEDFIELRYKIVDDYYKNPSSYATTLSKFDYIINGTFPYIKSGDYTTKMTYILPGGIVRSSTKFIYVNP